MARKTSKQKESTESPRKKVVVIGGGTGTYTVLSALREYPLELSAIVTMADSGGSTGILRDEFGVLPPGDLRQCLVALSDAPDVMRKLFTHRFDRGGLKGHSFGNLFLSTLEQVTGSLDQAIDVVGEILKIRGNVIPVTLENVTLVAKLKNGKMLRGESALTDYQLVSRFGIKELYLSPKPKPNPKALKAIAEADMIIVGPGNLYSSLIPNFLVSGISRAIAKAKAKKLYIVNLMNKHGHTDDFHVADYVAAIEKIINEEVFDTVLFNTQTPPKNLVHKYADEGEPVKFITDKRLKRRALVGHDLLAGAPKKKVKGDLLSRTLIRHDQKKLGTAIAELLNN